jgi:hypothetical protein
MSSLRTIAVGACMNSTAPAVAVGEQRLQRVGVARDRRVADDVDRVRARPGRRQHRIERARTRSLSRAADAGERRRIGAITPARRRWSSASVLVAVAPKRASVSAAMNRSCSVSTRSMPARRIAASNTMSEPASAPVCEARRLHAAAGAAAFTTITGLLRARPRARRHELARRLDRFDVEQDRARARVAREVVEQVAEVDVGSSPSDTMCEKPMRRAWPSRAPR